MANIENHIHNGLTKGVAPNYMTQGAYLQHGFRPMDITLETSMGPSGRGSDYDHHWYVGSTRYDYPEVVGKISGNYRVWLENGHPDMVGWSGAKRWRFYHSK